MKHLLASLLVFASFSALARDRVVQPRGIPAPRSVMWIGAHPDDEAVAAPLLASWCRENHARCAILVFTRGDRGVCLRPDGCAPDIATVRSSEVGAASQYFGADSILLSFPDGGGSLPPSWQPGDTPDDKAITLSRYIAAFDPELILTFDPRHGTTCHPDHKAVASLVLQAVKLLPAPPQVYLLETRITFVAEPFALHFTSAISNADRFDANVTLQSTFEPAWNAVIDDMRRHASQFDDGWIRAVQNVPSSERAVFIGAATSMLQEPVANCP
jgi:LmbE family N-acetylglucosaminyl deacetylase